MGSIIRLIKMMSIDEILVNNDLLNESYMGE